MSDLISRQAAETLFRNARKVLMEQSRKEYIKDFNTRDLMLLNAEQLIHLLPSVEPGKKKGKWIDVEKYKGILFECDSCHKYQGTIKYLFCPKCGVKMEVDA